MCNVSYPFLCSSMCTCIRVLKALYGKCTSSPFCLYTCMYTAGQIMLHVTSSTRSNRGKGQRELLQLLSSSHSPFSLEAGQGRGRGRALVLPWNRVWSIHLPTAQASAGCCVRCWRQWQGQNVILHFTAWNWHLLPRKLARENQDSTLKWSEK